MEAQPNTRVAIYARISQDRTGAGLKVDAQIEACQELADRHGYEVVATFRDDDTSAYSGKPRNGYIALLELLETGSVNMVLALHEDRLHRSPIELEHYIDVCQPHEIATDFVMSGRLDLHTASGRMTARIRGAVAREEVEHKSEREQAKRARIARSGLPHLAARPYGWEQGSLVVRESEAAVVREIVTRLIDGETGTRIALDLNGRNIPTVKGARWTGIGVKKTAGRASNAALRDHKGTIYEGDPSWQAIISREDYERVRAVLSRPVTVFRRGKGRKYPFTGFVVCGACGMALAVGSGRSNAGVSAYRCDVRSTNDPKPRGCGQVQRAQIPVDYLIKEALIDRLDTEGLAKALADLESDQAAITSTLEDLRRQRDRLNHLVDDYAEGILDREQFTRAKNLAQANLDELEKKAASLSSGTALRHVDFSQDIRQTIETADLHLLRSLAELLIKEVRIMPLPKKGWKLEHLEIDGHRYRFSPEYVELVWL